MPERPDIPDAFFSDEFSQLEQIIRQAGSYVEVSPDLRPQVIEVARDRRSQRRAAAYTVVATALLLAIGTGMETLAARWRSTASSADYELLTPNSTELLAIADSPQEITKREPAAWNLARVFSDLRTRQAKFIKSAF